MKKGYADLLGVYGQRITEVLFSCWKKVLAIPTKMWQGNIITHEVSVEIINAKIERI